MGNHSPAAFVKMNSSLIFTLSALAILCMASADEDSACPQITWIDTWPNGRKGAISFTAPATFTNGWILKLTFDKDINQLHSYNGMNNQCNGTTGSFESESYNANITEGTVMALGFDIGFAEDGLPPADVISAKLSAKPDQGPTDSKEYELCQDEYDQVLEYQLSDDDDKVCNNSFSLDNSYPHGYVGTLYLESPVNVTGWVTRVKMTHPFKHMSVFNGHNLTCTDQVCYFSNNEWNAELIAGEKMPLGFQVDYECGQPCPLPGCIKVNGGIMCGHDDDDNPTTPTP